VFNPAVLEDSAPPLFHHSCDGLVSVHHYLCRRAARKFWRPGLERCDLEQVAAVGLIKAARRFDPSVRTPFEAFAWMTILGELMHYVRDHERAVRVPRRLRTLETKFARAHETLLGRLGREPNDAEIAAVMGVLAATVAEVRGACAAAQPVTIEAAEVAALREPGALNLEDGLLVRSAFAGLTQIERRVIAGVTCSV
jgi:RNA polymerase sigma-B factor